MAAATQAPAQNMLAADRRGRIAIRSTGRFPIRPGDGRGSRLFDGTRSASDWTGDLPLAQWPQAVDPAQGFLASANQQPIDPRATTAWLGGSYDPWRALRLNALLRADSSVTVDEMRALQTDPGSARADHFVPLLLDAARRVSSRAGSGVNLAVLREAASLLAEWDRRYTTKDQRAVLFEAAMREVAQRTWDELQSDPANGSGPRVATPSTAVLARLMADSASTWWTTGARPRSRIATSCCRTASSPRCSRRASATARPTREDGPGVRSAMPTSTTCCASRISPRSPCRCRPVRAR
jgi:penicillin amidase